MASKTVTRSIFNVFYKTVVLGFIYPVDAQRDAVFAKREVEKRITKVKFFD